MFVVDFLSDTIIFLLPEEAVTIFTIKLDTFADNHVVNRAWLRFTIFRLQCR
jgi:hypothetical protein